MIILLDVQNLLPNPEHEYNLRAKIVKMHKKKCEKYNTLCSMCNKHRKFQYNTSSHKQQKLARAKRFYQD